jgi:hypothetical protein
MIALTEHVDENLHVAENGVVLKVALEETVLSTAVPQIENQVAEKPDICVLHVNCENNG